MKRPKQPILVSGKNVSDVAVVTSQTACAPVVSSLTDVREKHESSRHHGLAEKLHGLTEKIHAIGGGHSRHDSSGGSDVGKRSRAGRDITSVHAS